MSRQIIPQSEFEHIDTIDLDYIDQLKRQFTKTKKTLPSYADFYGYKIMEDNICFNGRLIASGIKSRYITPAMETHVKQRIETYYAVLERLHGLLRTSSALQKYFHLSEEEIKILSTDHGYRSIIPFARFDSVLTPKDGLRVYELNTNCAASVGWLEMMNRVVSQFPFWDSFKEKYRIRYYNDYARFFLNLILGAYREWGGKQKKPSILILRWTGQYNQDSDFVCQEFQKMGFRAMIGYVPQVAYSNGRLSYQGTEYELVLKWFDLDHLLHDVSHVYQDLLRAYYDNAICMVNPLSSAILAHKSLFAFFTDEQFNQYITKKEREILGNMCPWTRIIEKRDTVLWTGEQGPLEKLLHKNQADLLIKPSIGTYGANIIIGKKVSPAAWRKAIQHGMNAGGWIVQEYITIPRHYEPYVHGSNVSAKKFNHDFGPYMSNGKYAGAMARCSHNLITNLMQDGAFQLVGVVKKKY